VDICLRRVFILVFILIIPVSFVVSFVVSGLTRTSDARLIGQLGGDYLRDALSHRNPTMVINEFQQSNALSVAMFVAVSSTSSSCIILFLINGHQ
jgi:hypothetical protein